jgi:pimeloyl-ACP methyl ester carboxylesterase
MPILSRRAYRYGRAWLSGPVDIDEAEVGLVRDGVPVPATLVRPRAAREALPGWVVLHGMTRPGRSHPQLARFTRCLVSTGAVAIVPEVPEWRALDFAPDLASRTVVAALAGLRDSGWALDAPVAVIGFSFGAPHALAASTDPDLEGRLSHAGGFGGYCDIEATLRFMMTGAHEWGGRTVRLTPDPYARWLVGANYLARTPDHADASDVADALRALAAHSGDVGAPTHDPVYLPEIARRRASVAEERRPLFDLFVPPGWTPIPDEPAAHLTETLAETARRVCPSLDPRPALARVRTPAHVLHGVSDTLIPCSEARKLRDALPGATRSHLTVTRLFGHTGQDVPSPLRTLGEAPRFTRALSRLFATG